MKIWPFNRKKKIKDSQSESIAFTHATTRKTSIASVLGSFITAFMILGAGVTGIGISAWKQTLGSEFSKSYSIRYELEPHDEQDYKFNESIHTSHPETYPELAKDAADSYSRYLHEKGVDDINVYPEWIPNENDKTNQNDGRIFINAILPNDYYYNKVEDKRIEIPSPDIYMNYVNSSRLTAIIQIDKNDERKLAVVPLNQYIDSNHPASINSKNPTEVDIKLNTSFSNIVNDYLDNTAPSSSNDEVNNTQIYIVQNYYELLNYLTYILQVEYGYSQLHDSSFTDIYNYLDSLNDGEKTFYSDYTSAHTFSSASETRLVGTEINNYQGYVGTKVGSNGIELTGTPIKDDNGITTDAFLYFESKKDSDHWAPTGSLNYNFLKKYILAFGQPDKKEPESAEPAANSFLKILPNKNPTNIKEESNWEWLTINASDRYQAKNIVNGIQNYSFSLPVKAVTKEGYDPKNVNTNSIFGNINSNTTEIEQSFHPTIFGYKPIVGLIISLCLIILGIGIIVSILYRVPGLFGFFTILGAFGLTLMTMILSNYAISLGLFLGLLVGVLGSCLGLFSWCSRIRKLNRTGLIFDLAVRKGIKHGFLQVIDIHLIMLLLGICISYFGANQIGVFGNTLLIFSVISFALTGLIWMILTLLLFNNQIGSTKLRWFFRKKIEKNVTLVPDKNYETVFSGKFEAKRFSVFGKRQIICASLVGLIAIMGIILITVVGVHSSYMFYGGSRLMMTEATYNAHIADFVGYSDLVHANDSSVVYLYYDHTFNLGNLPWVNLYLPDNQPWQNVSGFVSLQSISAAGALDYAKTSIYMLLIGSGLISLYTFVRLNWVSVIPVFLGLVLTPLVAIGIVAICQVYFDVYVIMALTTIYMINAFLVIHLVGVLNNHWIRKQIFNFQDLRKIFNTEIKNSLFFYAWCYGMLIGTFVIMLIFNSTTLIWFNLVIIIGILASLPTLYAIVPFCLYVFVRLRYRYLLSSNFENPLLRKNYDLVDEQLIDGINRFKRKKPTL